MAENQNQSKGRGWHGDPEGHAKAGKKGGSRRKSSDTIHENSQ